MLDLGAVDAFLESSHQDRARSIDVFVQQHIAGHHDPEDDDAARARARELVSIFGHGDWYAPIFEPDLRSCALMREALGACSPLADATFALQALGTTPILMAGSEALQSRWLPAIRRGEVMTAFAMTEPEAGSDAANIQTRARRDGEDYVLDGVKTFITNAGIADLYIVFASTDPEQGARGISAFLVPASTPGCVFRKAQILSAPHPLGEMGFEGCRIPASHRLGEEGKGLGVALGTLDRIRATVGAAACGMATRALDEAVKHALTRRQFGEPLASFQLVQQKIARMATDLTASRLLVYRALWEKDRGAARITMESGMAKYYATEAAQRIIDDAVQILGGRGVLVDGPVDHLYRAVRALRIYEGTTEIQQLLIAKQVLKRAQRSET